MTSSSSPRIIVLSIALALGSPLPALAQDAAIAGRVTDRQGEAALSGARITILELGRSTASDARGFYRFSALPDGDYTLRVEYLGADPVEQRVTARGGEIVTRNLLVGEDVARLSNVLVVGQAAGQAAAINRQRAADNIINVVSSDAIGQLPDQNVTEALQRVPGISITRDQGEGRFITIRGVDPQLNAITINGARVPSAENDARQVALDVIPSDLLESLEVTKTLTPAMDADAIGGSVEIKSLSAFDRGGQSASLRVEGSYNDLEEAWSPKVSGNWTNIFDVGAGELGVAIAASYFDREFGSDNLEVGDGWEEYEGPDGATGFGPIEAEQRDYLVNRERIGLAFNLDYVLDAGNKFYLRTLYSDFEDDEQRRANILTFEDGDPVSVAADEAFFEGTEITREFRDRLETQTITSVVAGGEHFLDRWSIDYNASYSIAEEEEPLALEAAFENDFDVGYRRASRELFTIVGGEEVFDAGNYELDAIEFADNLTEDEEIGLAFNARYEMDFGNAPGYLQFGVKYRQREKFNDETVDVYEDFGGDFTINDFLFTGVDYGLDRFGPHVDQRAINDFFFSGRGGFGRDDEASEIDSLAADYTIEEDVFAGYGMLQGQFGRLTVLAGVRYEATEVESSGIEVVIDEELGDGTPAFNPIDTSRDYFDIFPSLNLRYDVSDELIVRGAITTSLVRPIFEQLAPFAVLEIEEDDGEFERNAELGNPDLDPYKATNIDFGVEYYTGGIGLFSAGIFYKDIEDFIVLADVAGQGEFVGFDEAIQPLNGDDADLWGLELGYVQRFDTLPAPWDGFLVSANYTYVDSEATLPFRQQSISLPRTSENVANLAVGYETPSWSIRVAAAYRDRYFDEITELDDPFLDQYVDEHIQFDLSARWFLNSYTQLYFEAINMDDEPLYRYFGQPRFNAQFEEYSWTAQAGVRLFF